MTTRCLETSPGHGHWSHCRRCGASLPPRVRHVSVFNRRTGDAPGDAVYVGRGSPWGNPFVIGRDGDRDEVCDRFEREILPTLDLAPLRGRHLVCYCAPARCHADALLREANR